MYNNQYLIKPTYRGNDSKRQNYWEREEKEISLRESYDKFSLNVQNFLVSESINFLLQPCLEGKSKENKEYGKVLCEQFVIENGSSNLLRQFGRKSQLLYEISNIVHEIYDDVMCKVDKQDALTFVIKPSDKKDFYNKLSDLSPEEISKEVNERTCKAAQEFIQNNINDKLDMEEIAAKTKEKIDNVKATNTEKKKELQKEYANMAKVRMNQIVYNRKKNVYEQMVHNFTNQIIKNENLYPSFVNESGKLNMDSITEKVDVMYRFLETINTAKIYDVNESYISELLDSIK